MSFGRHGPSDVFILLDGYQMTLNDIQSAEYEETAEQTENTGLGDSFREHTPTGIKQTAYAASGAVFDDASRRSRDALESLSTGPRTDPRILCLGAAQSVIGAHCVGFEGAIQQNYKVLISFEDLQRVNATFQMSGARDEGRVVHPIGQVTSDENGESSSIDLGASSTGIVVGYLQLEKTTGGDGITVSIEHSSDDISWSELLAFTSVSSTSPAAERIESTGGVSRYIAYSHAFGAAGSTGDATYFSMLGVPSTY